MAALQVRGGVIDGRHRQVNLAVHVVQDRFDDRLAPGQEEVLSVGTSAAWPHLHPAAAGDPGAVHQDVIGLR